MRATGGVLAQASESAVVAVLLDDEVGHGVRVQRRAERRVQAAAMHLEASAAGATGAAGAREGGWQQRVGRGRSDNSEGWHTRARETAEGEECREKAE